MALPTILTTPPRRGLTTDVLLQNLSGAVLLVETAGRDGYRLPGGPAEENELPHHAAARHLELQTGLAIPLRYVVAVDFSPAQLLPDGLNLVFRAPRATGLQEQAVARHQLPDGIKALHWIHGLKLETVMEPARFRRLQAAREADRHYRALPFLLRGTPAK